VVIGIKGVATSDIRERGRTCVCRRVWARTLVLLEWHTAPRSCLLQKLDNGRLRYAQESPTKLTTETTVNKHIAANIDNTHRLHVGGNTKSRPRSAVADAVASTSFRNRCGVRVLSHTAARTRPSCRTQHLRGFAARAYNVRVQRLGLDGTRAAGTHRKDPQRIRFHAGLESLAVALLTLIIIFIKVIVIVVCDGNHGVLVKDANSEPRCKHSLPPRR
jgi:hypothetical protein